MGGPATLFSNPPSLEEKVAKSPSIGARHHELNLRVLNELNGPMWSRDAILDEAAASLAEEKRTPSKKPRWRRTFLPPLHLVREPADPPGGRRGRLAGKGEVTFSTPTARLDGRLVDFRAFLVPDQDIIAALSESRLLGANPVGDELGVILCFLPGTALMSPDVMRRKFPGQIEEKPLHAKRNADADPLFLTHR